MPSRETLRVLEVSPKWASRGSEGRPFERLANADAVAAPAFLLSNFLHVEIKAWK